jgi:outer membrane protein assembly factor BamD
MHVSAYRRLAVVGCLLALGCRGFRVQDYPNSTDLYRESLRRLEAGKEEDAISGFEKLTLELPARDTLLPRAHFYLGRAHAKRKDWLLAGQAFTRMASEFPDDSLADDALLEAGNAYARIWDDPELDPTYGQSAIAVYTSLLDTYPNSALRSAAEQGVAKVRAQLAEKDFRNGEQYRRRAAPHSAIFYYRQVLNNYPDAPRVKDAYARMAEVYKKIGYVEDYRETCAAARPRFPADRDIRAVCAEAPVVADSATTSPPPASPPPAAPPP